MVCEHVAKYITRCTQSLNRFQEFIMVLIKLRLNVPFQDLAYRFVVSVSTVSSIFSSWMMVMDARLSPLDFWPDRERLWRTMPMSFPYAFGKQVTVIIDCFEVFIDRPTNLLARAPTFSYYKHRNSKNSYWNYSTRNCLFCVWGLGWPHLWQVFDWELWVFRKPTSLWHGHGWSGIYYLW